MITLMLKHKQNNKVELAVIASGISCNLSHIEIDE